MRLKKPLYYQIVTCARVRTRKINAIYTVSFVTFLLLNCYQHSLLYPFVAKAYNEY